MTSKRKKTAITISAILISLIISAGIIGKIYYSKFFSPNVNKTTLLYIPANAEYGDVIDSLENNEILKDIKSFELLAKYKNYSKKIKAGRYEIKEGMSNNTIVNILRSGRQKPVKVTFNNIRTKNELAGKIAKQIEADSLSIVELLNNRTIISEAGFDENTVISMFIPNTYELYWDISAKDFFDRMNTEYKKFWNKKRREKAEKIGLSQIQVSVLASIVQAEQACIMMKNQLLPEYI